MRCAIVKASALARHRNWDIGFFSVRKLENDVTRAEITLKRALTSLANRKAALGAEYARWAKLIISGDVVELDRGDK